MKESKTEQERERTEKQNISKLVKQASQSQEGRAQGFAFLTCSSDEIDIHRPMRFSEQFD